MLVGKAELTTDTKDTTSAFHKAVIFIRLDSPFSQTEVFNQLRIINHRHLHNWVPCILSIISVPPYEPFNDPNQRLAVLFIAPKQTWERETSPELEDDKMSLSLASKNLLLPISALHHCNKTHTSIDSPFHAKMNLRSILILTLRIVTFSGIELWRCWARYRNSPGPKWEHHRCTHTAWWARCPKRQWKTPAMPWVWGNPMCCNHNNNHLSISDPLNPKPYSQQRIMNRRAYKLKRMYV